MKGLYLYLYLYLLGRSRHSDHDVSPMGLGKLGTECEEAIAGHQSGAVVGGSCAFAIPSLPFPEVGRVDRLCVLAAACWLRPLLIRLKLLLNYMCMRLNSFATTARLRTARTRQAPPDMGTGGAPDRAPGDHRRRGSELRPVGGGLAVKRGSSVLSLTGTRFSSCTAGNGT